MRFSIRDLFWLTAVVALAVGWWVDHRRHEQSILETRAKMRYELRLEMEGPRKPPAVETDPRDDPFYSDP